MLLTYVKPKTHIDKEAKKRGNSTYLVDRVIPMLPEKIIKPNMLFKTERR